MYDALTAASGGYRVDRGFVRRTAVDPHCNGHQPLRYSCAIGDGPHATVVSE